MTRKKNVCFFFCLALMVPFLFSDWKEDIKGYLILNDFKNMKTYLEYKIDTEIP